jgi:hypothetical protein
MRLADLIKMLKLILFFALQVTTPGEMSCIDSAVETRMPADLYIVGSADGGTLSMLTQEQILYLNGPKSPSLKIGDINQVVRPMGVVRDPLTGKMLGIHYKNLGSIHIEVVNKDNAVARVLHSCQAFVKGDLVFPSVQKPLVYFNEELSNETTQIPENGMIGHVLFANNEKLYLSAGQFCFVGRGKRDGVKLGDRFTVFRASAPYGQQDISIGKSVAPSMLSKHKPPSRILGDIVIVDVEEKISTGKIINCLSEISRGDLAIRR